MLAAVVLLVAACTMKKTEQPSFSGPSELALSVALSANPDVISQDGASQSQIVIQARDANGQAIKNLPLTMGLAVNNTYTAVGRLSAMSVTTDTDGRATVTYTAPPAGGRTDTGTRVTISATPTGTDYANAVARTVDIRLVPANGTVSGPVASFSFLPANPIAFANVNFNGSDSRSDGGTITSYSWDFGDSSTGTGSNPQHMYRATGNYTAVLTVTDSNGKVSNPASQVVPVGTSTSPTADFVYSPSSPAPLDTVFFNASLSKPASGRSLVRYVWNFGDGNTGAGITSTNVYATANTFTVTLVVTDDVGQQASKSLTVRVQ